MCVLGYKYQDREIIYIYTLYYIHGECNVNIAQY